MPLSMPHSPRLLGGIAKQKDHAEQRRLAVRLLHADAPNLKPRLIALVGLLQDLLTSAGSWLPSLAGSRPRRRFWPKTMA